MCKELIKLKIHFEQYKKSKFLYEAFTGEIPMTTLIEISNALEHIINIAEQNDAVLLDKELNKAKQHLQRATKDNIKLIIIEVKRKFFDAKFETLNKKLDNIAKKIEKEDDKVLQESIDDLFKELNQIDYYYTTYQQLLSNKMKSTILDSFKYFSLGVGVSIIASFIFNLLTK